jgi:hypothetical protein
LPIDHPAARAGVRVTERLEHPGGVSQGKTASRHGRRRTGTHTIEEFGLGGAEVLKCALKSSSRAGRLHHLVILNQQWREGEPLIDASYANESVDRGVAPSLLVTWQSRQKNEGHPVAQHGRCFDFAPWS